MHFAATLCHLGLQKCLSYWSFYVGFPLPTLSSSLQLGGGGALRDKDLSSYLIRASCEGGAKLPPLRLVPGVCGWILKFEPKLELGDLFLIHWYNFCWCWWYWVSLLKMPFILEQFCDVLSFRGFFMEFHWWPASFNLHVPEMVALCVQVGSCVLWIDFQVQAQTWTLKPLPHSTTAVLFLGDICSSSRNVMHFAAIFCDLERQRWFHSLECFWWGCHSQLKLNLEPLTKMCFVSRLVSAFVDWFTNSSPKPEFGNLFLIPPSTIAVVVGETGSLARNVMHFAATLYLLESFYGIDTCSLMAQGTRWGSEICLKNWYLLFVDCCWT